MKITRSQLRREIIETMQAVEEPSGPDITPGFARVGPGVMSGIKKGISTGVTDIAGAYKSLQAGEDFEISIPQGLADALNNWLSRISGCVTMNEGRRALKESPVHLIAGIGIGVLALCVMAMVMGYEADVDVGGEVIGQAGHARVVLKSPTGNSL